MAIAYRMGGKRILSVPKRRRIEKYIMEGPSKKGVVEALKYKYPKAKSITVVYLGVSPRRGFTSKKKGAKRFFSLVDR